MAKVEDCPGFETFGADVKAAREKLGISRRELAEKIGVDPRYSYSTCVIYRQKSISIRCCGRKKQSNASV